MAQQSQLVEDHAEVNAAAMAFRAMLTRTWAKNNLFYDEDKATMGSIRNLIREVEDSMTPLCQAIEIVLAKMNRTNEQSAENMSWEMIWKPLSMKGYCTFQGGSRCKDMGNLEYTIVLTICANSHMGVGRELQRLANTYESLSLSHPLTDHAISMKGDVVEICLAAFMADDFFREELLTQTTSFPKLLTYLKSFCRLVHLLDAHLVTRHLKYRDEYARLLPWGKNGAPSFVVLWRDYTKRAALLEALLQSV